MFNEEKVYFFFFVCSTTKPDRVGSAVDGRCGCGVGSFFFADGFGGALLHAPASGAFVPVFLPNVGKSSVFGFWGLCFLICSESTGPQFEGALEGFFALLLLVPPFVVVLAMTYVGPPCSVGHDSCTSSGCFPLFDWFCPTSLLW